MSLYLALFGRRFDLTGLRAVSILPETEVSEFGLRTMLELASAYGLDDACFVVDETGDTAHELISEAWSDDCGQLGFDGTRFGRLLKRAEQSGTSLAAWDATWDESTSGAVRHFTSYGDLRAHLAQCKSEWEVDGLLCVPRRAEHVDEDAGV